MTERKELPILLFDGPCKLCNQGVQFFLKRDKKGIIHYASLQSEVGQGLLKKFGLPQDKFESLVLVVGNRYWLKSNAIIQASSMLGKRYSLLFFLKVFPRFLRDPVYSFVATNRYRWFGRSEECFLPDARYKNRFLE